MFRFARIVTQLLVNISSARRQRQPGNVQRNHPFSDRTYGVNSEDQ